MSDQPAAPDMPDSPSSTMTATTVRPEVSEFVAQVRARLLDLTEDERDELLGGLEADLSDQLADQMVNGGAGLLDDPTGYAAELRAAAGFPEPRGRRLRTLRIPTGSAVPTALDGWRRRWDTWVTTSAWRREAWELLRAVRPVWWVARGWIAVSLIDVLMGPWEYVALVPTLVVPGLGLLLLLLTVVASVLVGLGRTPLRGGPGAPARPRLMLLAVNLAVLVAAVPVLDGLPDGRIDHAGFYRGPTSPPSGLRLDGRPVRNVFPYDAEGQPVTGIQLYDQNGKALALTARQTAEGRGRDRTVGCGWHNGSSVLLNVFPLAERAQQRGTCADTAADAGPVTEPAPPLAQVPPAAPPGADE